MCIFFFRLKFFLKDEKTVGELQIKAGAVIHAVLNLRGGAQ
jgi:hypothetical protein